MAVRGLMLALAERVFGEGRIEDLEVLCAPSIVDHLNPGNLVSQAAIAARVQRLRCGLPDMSVRVDGMVCEGELGFLHWTVEGTHSGELLGVPPTERKVRFSGIDAGRVSDGRLSELWRIEETLQLRQQIAGLAHLNDPAEFHPRPRAEADRHPPTSERLRTAARQHVEEVWARGDVDLARSFYRPDVVDHNAGPGQRAGVEGILDLLTLLPQSAPDVRLRVEHCIVEGDFAADLWVMTGTHSGAPLMGMPARHVPFQICGIDIARFDDAELIDAVWHAEELDSLIRQLSSDVAAEQLAR